MPGELGILVGLPIARIRNRYGLTSRYDRLRKAGMLSVQEMAVELGITPQSVKIWNRHGLIRGHAYNDKDEYLFEHPGNNPPRKAQGVKFSKRRLVDEVIAERRASTRRFVLLFSGSGLIVADIYVQN